MGCGYVLVCVHRRAWVQARGWGGIGKILQGCLVAQSLMLWSPGLGGAPQHLPPHPHLCWFPPIPLRTQGEDCPSHPCLEHSRSARRDANTVPGGCRASPAPPQGARRGNGSLSALPPPSRKPAPTDPPSWRLNHPSFCQTNEALHCHHKRVHRHRLG